MIKAGGYVPYFNENFENGMDFRFWTIENPDDGITWETHTVGGSGHGEYAASIYFYEYYTFTQRDRLISPSFNLEGMSNASLEFDHAYAKRYSQVSDSLIVLISEDCGETWTTLLSLGDDGNGSFATHTQTTEGFVPQTLDDWCGSGYGSQCYSVNLDQYAGSSNIKIAFESYNANGNPLYLDNVLISQFLDIDENDLSVEEIQIYPNPTNGSFVINYSDMDLFETLELVNHLGQLMTKSKINKSTSSIEINTNSELLPGVYFIKLSGHGKTISRKVVIL